MSAGALHVTLLHKENHTSRTLPAQEQEIVYGAVTIGDGWRFGKLEQATRTITQDILLYSVPSQLQQLLQILIGLIEAMPYELSR